MRAGLAVALCVLAVTGLAPTAAIADGQLTYDGCLANDATDGCVDLPGAPLREARAVAVSPDGGSVYVGSARAASVSHFSRAPQGQLSFNLCLADDSMGGCVDLPNTPLSDVTAVAVSPDGGSVYVASGTANSVAHFLGGAQGQLSFDTCLADDAADACVDLPNTPLSGATSVAVSPDGASVYVTGANSTISHFSRVSQGQLTFVGCLGDDGSDGCIDLPNTPLTFADSVAVSPDGGSVYVASPGANAVAHFFRDPQGQLTYDGCHADDATDGCVDLSNTPLTGASAVAVSPDGASVYVVATGTVAHFLRASQGQLTFDSCLANDATDGCVDLPDSPLLGARAVAVSPDGGSVYVASGGANSVAHFFRAVQGQLTYDRCFADDDGEGCVDLPATPLTGADSVAVSPDGGSVYVASFDGNSVAHFFRAVPTTTSTTTTSTTLPGTCPQAATFTSIDCRLAALIERVGGAAGLDATRAKFLATLGKARTRTAEAEASCAAANAKRTKRQLRQGSGKLDQYRRRLRNKKARRSIDPSLRAALLADGDSIRVDLKALRGALSCGGV